MTKKCRAILSLPAVLLRKVSNVEREFLPRFRIPRQLHSAQGCFRCGGSLRSKILGPRTPLPPPPDGMGPGCHAVQGC